MKNSPERINSIFEQAKESVNQKIGQYKLSIKSGEQKEKRMNSEHSLYYFPRLS